MTISVILNYEDNRIVEGQDYRLTVVDERRMEKIPLIKALRSLTGANLKSSKRAIETLRDSGAVIFKANLGWNAEKASAGQFEDFGVRLTNEIEEIDEYDHRGQCVKRQTELLMRIPNLPQREDPTCEQLADLLLVAHRLGMHGAAEALEAWRKSVELAKEPASYYAPMG